MPLILTLASRNLFHDRLRLVATVIGIVFSIVLVTVQIGLFLGFGRMVTTMIDHAPADLWIVPKGTKCFEDPSLIDERERFRALSINGVARAAPVLIGFGSGEIRPAARRRCSSSVPTSGPPSLHPWNLVQGSLEALSIPDGVAIDQSYFERLGHRGSAPPPKSATRRCG